MENILKNYLSSVFIETGVFEGNGIEEAKQAGFKKIISIEISEKFCREARKRFKDNDNIFIEQGDSSVILWPIIKDIKERITFMLDAHNLLCDTEVPTDKGFEWWPLMKELKIIAKHPRKDHTIIIDDVRLFDIHFETTLKEVKCLILEINPNYRFHFLDVVLDEGLVKNNILIAEIEEK